MNRKNILTELMELLSGIDLHASLVDEIIDIIAKSGNRFLSNLKNCYVSFLPWASMPYSI